MLAFIESFDMIRFSSKKLSQKNVISKIKGDLMWPSITSQVTLYLMKNLHLYDNILGNFCQNMFINEYDWEGHFVRIL